MYAWIDMASFTPWSALIGGLIIGLAASVLIVGSGHIMGMSGILKSSLSQLPTLSWQLVFVIGMAVATWGYGLIFGFPQLEMGQPIWKIILAGLLVGFGTRLGSGCTSGHGICGISRLSPRSITATILFLSSGIVTATLFAMIQG
ncbi:YeeE/YedE family protein [Psychrobacter phenylpyruvicus]|uniref:Predicted transporter component n=1 Tax=Psychrobacter phenylpyruvicus TaxID=29432 RepID=A0A379LN26_9GAMM|nr:YeeE/YedE thiosulfate transporter family protein [Psychrobacter phenylpyruvicus]SUD91184.1 Predicted transporter component [Psychrobacter phenylpyruvicus]